MGSGRSGINHDNDKVINTSDGLKQAEWEVRNRQVAENFDNWLDSNDKKALNIDKYNTFEKMSLAETRKWLKPNSEKGFSYNDGDEVPEDNWWYIEYGDGTTVRLEPGDSLKNVKRNDINYAVNENAETTMIYSKKGSGYIGIYNDSRYEENNDIWLWERK